MTLAPGHTRFEGSLCDAARPVTGQLRNCGQPNLIAHMHQKSRGSEVEKEILSREKEREEEGKGREGEKMDG